METPPHAMNPADEIVDLVDESNRVVGKATRREVRARNLLHRGVGILCRNSRGQVYVHRRTRTKDIFPGMYDMFVGGVVASGEGAAQAARREILEELGIDGPEPKHLFDHLYLGPRNRAWVAVYEVEWDGPIRHQDSEVEWGSYFSLPEVIAKLREWEFVPDGIEIFHRLFEERSSTPPQLTSSCKGSSSPGSDRPLPRETARREPAPP